MQCMVTSISFKIIGSTLSSRRGTHRGKVHESSEIDLSVSLNLLLIKAVARNTTGRQQRNGQRFCFFYQILSGCSVGNEDKERLLTILCVHSRPDVMQNM